MPRMPGPPVTHYQHYVEPTIDEEGNHLIRCWASYDSPEFAPDGGKIKEAWVAKEFISDAPTCLECVALGPATEVDDERSWNDDGYDNPFP